MMLPPSTGKKEPLAISHDDRIVIMGMSCVGKTEFAKQVDREYICFDALFPWHEIETLGLSISAAMENVKAVCEDIPKFVLDGWHLSDSTGDYLPSGCCVYVLYAPYDKIIEQYRVDVAEHEQHRVMFNKWYSIEYPSFKARYFLNDGQFVEQSEMEFRGFLLRENVIDKL